MTLEVGACFPIFPLQCEASRRGAEAYGHSVFRLQVEVVGGEHALVHAVLVADDATLHHVLSGCG